jgi:glycosyltransferase involved in cell wall biosynthesis
MHGALPSEHRRVVKVFVFLGYGFGATRWRMRHARGEIPGLNGPLPYGYNRAESEEWHIEYSEDAGEGRIGRLCRRGLTRALGFDVIHAWRHRRQLLAADVVWTHSERENLAVLALFRVFRPQSPPRVLAQCIWLFDRWPDLSAPTRALYRRLLASADVVTTLSRSNLALAHRLLPATRCEFLPFGATSPDAIRAPGRSPAHHPIRLASLGGDMHRDWKTLLSAFAGRSGFELRIASAKATIHMDRNFQNVRIRPARCESDVRALYGWADVVVLSLKENQHASGITVILESVASGTPVVTTDTGGLRDYFSEMEICYVPPEDPAVLRDAVRHLVADRDRMFAMATAAQARLLAADLTSEGYALRHRTLSEGLLNQRTALKSLPSATALA